VSVRTWLGSLPLTPGPSPTRGEGNEGDERYSIPCGVHTWHPSRARDADDLSALAERLRELSERLARGIGAETDGPAILRLAERIRRGSALPPGVTAGLECSWCDEQLSYEIATVGHLEATTLCAPHLRVAAGHARSFEAMRAETRHTWRTIEGQLDEVIRKYDYRFQREPRGEEQGSPRWAVALVAGEEGMR
jgi:hypothetical protein